MKKLPLGIQTFAKIIKKRHVYVDKTRHIAKLIQSGEYIFLSRPRRFGKSLLVSTLFEIFSGNKDLFKGLYIYDKIEWQKHPIIHIDFSVIDSELQEGLLDLLDDLNTEYQLGISKRGFKAYFKKIIQALSEKKGNVVVLIDEYDKSIVDHSNNIEKTMKNREILRDFFEVLKYSDAFLHFVFLTGVSKFSHLSIFSDLNNLRDITLSKQFSTILGYTQLELEQYFEPHIQALSIELGLEKTALLNKIKIWYNGYSWNAKDKMYNPFSIINLLAEQRFSNYWFSSGTPTFLIKMIQKMELDVCDFENKTVSEIVFDSYNIEKINIFALLFQTGYLTITHVDKKSRTPQYILNYPNFEVKEAFMTCLFEGFTDNGLEDIQPKAEEIRNYLQHGNLEGFITIIKALFANIPYILPIKQETYYHSLFYMILILMGGEIDLEVLTDKERVDSVLALDDIYYLIEFKYGKSGSDINDLTSQALTQIKNKYYSKRFLTEKRPCVYLGVGVTRKEISYKLSHTYVYPLLIKE